MVNFCTLYQCTNLEPNGMLLRLLPFVICTAIACAVVLNPLQAADALSSAQVGKVLVVKKQVEAHRPAHIEALKRKSPVFNNDLIVTGEQARSQFRLKDGTLFTLVNNLKCE